MKIISKNLCIAFLNTFRYSITDFQINMVRRDYSYQRVLNGLLDKFIL